MIEVKNINGIDYVEAGNKNSPDKIVLFHGYGADMFDLASLADVIRTRKDYHWIFPNGTLEVPIGPMMSGRAWFEIDISVLERHLRSGELSQRYPHGLQAARTKAEKFLKSLNIDFSRTILGGFSQGSMLVMDLLCETDIFPKGALLLSSTLLNKERWTQQMPSKKGLRFYQSHGEADPILPVQLAQELYEKLESAGWDGNLTLFRGGHEIPMKVIQEVASFLT